MKSIHDKPPLFSALSRGSPLLVVLVIAVAILLLFGIGSNFQLTALSSVVLLCGFSLLWRPGETPVLLFIFIYHWLQGSIYLFYSAISDTPLGEISEFTSSLDVTIMLTLLGAIFFAAGMRFGAGRQDERSIALCWKSVLQTTQLFWFLVYLGSWVTAVLVLALTALSPGLEQPLLAVANARWAAYFAFTMSSFANPRANKLLWMLVFVFEIASSLGGFFSSFKQVFIFSFFGIVAAATRITVPRALLLTGLTSVAILFGLVWTAVKPAYRAYVSAGETTQSVEVGRSAALEKLFALTAELSTAQLDAAGRQLVSRFAEIEIFGAAIDHVPRYVPHANGEIWYDAITRFLMPRILFPGKEIIDDSALTNIYTGLRVAGREQGTQISMGFYADSYIDFGPVGMMLALLVFGYLAGWIYRWLAYSHKGLGLIGTAFATVTLDRLESVGFSSAKVLPGLIISLVTYAMLLSLTPRLFATTVEAADPKAPARTKL